MSEILILCKTNVFRINNWKIHLQLDVFISFVVHSIIRLYNSCFGLCNFLFAMLAEGVQHQQITCLQATQVLLVTLCLIFCHIRM